MATQKLVAGAQAAYATAVTTALPALTSGQGWYSDLVIANGTNLDLFADVSIHLGTFNCVVPNRIDVYILTKNHSGTYGDGRTLASAFTGPPPSQYYRGSIVIDVSSAVQDGVLEGIRLPRQDFVFGFVNGQATTLNATNTVDYTTSNYSIA
jgi:hypothetical protein